MTEAELIDFMEKYGHSTLVEHIYLNVGPGKHEQDGMNGVSYVQMNVSLLEYWLSSADDVIDEEVEDEDGCHPTVDMRPAYEGWMALSNQAKRRVWEASGFHFGMCNSEEEVDVRRAFGLLGEAEEKMEKLKEWAQARWEAVEDEEMDSKDEEKTLILCGMAKAFQEMVKKLEE
jgi:hypothetical protein